MGGTRLARLMWTGDELRLDLRGSAGAEIRLCDGETGASPPPGPLVLIVRHRDPGELRERLHHRPEPR